MGVTGFKMQNRVKQLINASNSSGGLCGVSIRARRETSDFSAKMKAQHGLSGYAYKKRRINHDSYKVR